MSNPLKTVCYMQLTTFRNAASSKSSGATGKKVLFRMKELACICQEIKERKDPLKCIHFTNSSLEAKDLTEHRSSLETSAAYVSRFISEHVTVCSVTWWVDIQLRLSMKQISDGVTAVHMEFRDKG